MVAKNNIKIFKQKKKEMKYLGLYMSIKLTIEIKRKRAEIIF